MKLDIQIKGTIPVDLKIEDVITEINEMPLMERWGIISQLLHNIYLRNKSELNETQILVIKDFLKKQSKIYGNK